MEPGRMNASPSNSILRIARKLPPCLGGQEHHVVDLSRHQASNGTGQVTINFAMGDEIEEPGVACRKVIADWWMRLSGRDSVQAFLFGLATILANMVRRHENFGIVHVHGDIFEIAAAAVVAKRYRVPLVATLHAGLSLKSWYTFFASRILSLPDAVICVSDGIKEQVLEIAGGREEVHVISSGIKHERFRGTAKTGMSVPLRIVTVGRLHPMKGYGALISAVANAALRDNVSLRIIGAGPEEAKLKGIVEETGARVTFLGLKTKDEIAVELWGADVFVSSSVQLAEQTEGTPTVVMEAMSAGLPVIATDVGGSSAIVKSGINGYIVRQSDASAIMGALQRFMRDERLFRRMSQQNLVDSKAFDWSVVGNRILAVYNSALINKEKKKED